VASLFGSLLGSESLPPPTTDATADFASFYEGVIAGDQTTAMQAVTVSLNALLTDSAKLKFLGPLMEGPWAWDTDQTNELAKATRPFNRVYFYQQIMPRLFVLWNWANALYEPVAPGPGTPFWFYKQEYGGTLNVYFTPPSYTVWSFETNSDADGDQWYDIFVLAGRDSYVTDLSYPTQALTTDLFSSIGVRSTAFLDGTNGWSIPTIYYYPPSS
jgi:hypothetical protein